MHTHIRIHKAQIIEPIEEYWVKIITEHAYRAQTTNPYVVQITQRNLVQIIETYRKSYKAEILNR